MTTLFDERTEQPMATDLVEHRAEPTPMVLLQQAVESGLNPDHLEKLMMLQERWEKNQAEKAFAQAMHACQEEMPKVCKNARNKQTGSDYADLENIQGVARPIYTKHKFSLCFGEADCPLPNHKRTVCDVTHDEGHCRHYHLDLPVDGTGPKGNPIGSMNAVQGCISTTSYGQRRLTCMIFNITIVGEDDDGQSVSKITEEQLAVINDWIGLSEIKLGPFLRWLDIAKMSDLPQQKYDMVIAELKRKAAEKGVKVGG